MAHIIFFALSKSGLSRNRKSIATDYIHRVLKSHVITADEPSSCRELNSRGVGHYVRGKFFSSTAGCTATSADSLPNIVKSTWRVTGLRSLTSLLTCSVTGVSAKSVIATSGSRASGNLTNSMPRGVHDSNIQMKRVTELEMRQRISPGPMNLAWPDADYWANGTNQNPLRGYGNVKGALEITAAGGPPIVT